MLTTGERRTHHGHDGYDDVPHSHYSWDSTVPNHAQPDADDLIVIWNGKGLVGFSTIERIYFEENVPKVRKRCPACNATNIHLRVNRQPPFSCRVCRKEFVEPIIENITVDTYRSDHAGQWTEATEVLTKAELRECCVKSKSQHSIRQLDATKFYGALKSKSPEILTSWESRQQGHRRSQVKIRVGQRAFRQHLFNLYGNVCAVSGSHPLEVLEAAHLYSYAATSEHRSHGGLLLRRDIHRLFDIGLLAIDPDTDRIAMAAQLRDHPTYKHLQNAALNVELNERQREWIRLHFDQYAELHALS